MSNRHTLYTPFCGDDGEEIGDANLAAARRLSKEQFEKLFTPENQGELNEDGNE